MIKLLVLDKKTRKILCERTDREFIYKSLSSMLMSRYIFKSKMITRVYQHNLYNGYRSISFYLDNNVIYEYTVEE